jgi:hypothetical protein
MRNGEFHNAGTTKRYDPVGAALYFAAIHQTPQWFIAYKTIS